MFRSARDVPEIDPPLLISGEPVTQVEQQKYLGITFQANGKWNAHFDAIMAKGRKTASMIARIFDRNRDPSPTVARTLVLCVLLPQLMYGIAFCRLTKTQWERMLQLVAAPVRRALGLSRSASAIMTLWELGIPTPALFRLQCILQASNRACLSAEEGRFLPTLLRDDLRASRPVTVLEPFYCRPFACEVDVLQSQFPVLAPLPCKPVVVKSVLKEAMIKDWQSSLRVKTKAKKLKPSPDLPLYLHVDTQPAHHSGQAQIWCGSDTPASPPLSQE